VHAAARDKSAHGRVDAALERVGLGRRAGDKVRTYSLGMRQRLGVARRLVCDPELLILDEPVNGLDPAGILEFRNLIRELVAEGRTVLLASHLLDEVEKTCDVAAIVDKATSSRRARSPTWSSPRRARSTSTPSRACAPPGCWPRCPAWPAPPSATAASG
jgi:ABC-2 type transport system ATP-binding protein